MEDVTYSRSAHFYNLVHCGSVFTLEWFSLTLSKNATLTLLYYAGYLTMTVCYFCPMVLSVLISTKANDRFKIPNLEVMMDWARWIIGDVESWDILKTCVEGPVSDFTTKWPNFMQQQLDPKLVGKARGAARLRKESTMFCFGASCNPLERKAGKSPLNLELVVATSTFVCAIEGSVWLS